MHFKTEKVFMVIYNNYMAQIKDLDSLMGRVLCLSKVIRTNPAYQLQKFVLILLSFQLNFFFGVRHLFNYSDKVPVMILSKRKPLSKGIFAFTVHFT